MLSSFFRPCLYVQISPQLLTVRNPRTGEQFSEIPEVGLVHHPKTRIAGIGAQARSAIAGLQGEVVNPFAHPRSLVSDFTIAELLLKLAVRKLSGKRMLGVAPRIVMHPLGDPEGGFTQVERRAIREMGLGAGASTVVLWVGRILTDPELLSGRYLAEGTAE